MDDLRPVPRLPGRGVSLALRSRACGAQTDAFAGAPLRRQGAPKNLYSPFEKPLDPTASGRLVSGHAAQIDCRPAMRMEPMEIVYLSDVHDAFDRVKELLARTGADVYIIAGDLIDRPFYTEEMAARYRRRQVSFSALRHRLGYGDIAVEDFVDALLGRADVPEDVLRQAAEFQEETIRGRRVMQQKYKILESILRLKRSARLLCLPGNYDMDLQYTSLHERDLHRHWVQAEGLRIAGYGGADILTPGIPEQYAVKYRADRGASEMVRFFGEARPDIVATHKPAHGVHESSPVQGGERFDGASPVLRGEPGAPVPDGAPPRPVGLRGNRRHRVPQPFQFRGDP